MSDVWCQMIQVASCQLFGASSWKQAMIVDRCARVDPFCARPDILLLLYAPCILTLMPKKLWSCVCMAIGTGVQWNANVPKISKSSQKMKNFGRAGHFAQNAPIAISQDTRGHPCVFLGQKVLNRAAQIRERLHLKNLTRGWNCIQSLTGPGS